MATNALLYYPPAAQHVDERERLILEHLDKLQTGVQTEANHDV